jgi:hypothetical protein
LLSQNILHIFRLVIYSNNAPSKCKVCSHQKKNIWKLHLAHIHASNTWKEIKIRQPTSYDLNSALIILQVEPQTNWYRTQFWWCFVLLSHLILPVRSNPLFCFSQKKLHGLRLIHFTFVSRLHGSQVTNNTWLAISLNGRFICCSPISQPVAY